MTKNINRLLKMAVKIHPPKKPLFTVPTPVFVGNLRELWRSKYSRFLYGEFLCLVLNHLQERPGSKFVITDRDMLDGYTQGVMQGWDTGMAQAMGFPGDMTAFVEGWVMELANERNGGVIPHPNVESIA
jgi:hypothetical protein